jgi:predicted acetylornithine/succinylornithine family transaminase
MSVTIEEIPPKAKVATTTSDVAQSQSTSAQLEPRVEAVLLHSLVEIDAQVGVQNYGRLPVAFVRGQGARLWDSDGKEYLDFLGGIAVVPLGHAHPKISQAIAHQASTLIHTSNIFYIEPQVKLAEKLSELAGGMRSFFCNSGAEANEAAIKMVRKWQSNQGNGRFEIISAFDGFHGRTYGSLAATGQPKYHEGFGPMPEGFRYVEQNDVVALRAAITDKTAAVILEPIQGESGIRPATDEYLRAARQLCDENGVLLIIDEVQSGMGRTGKFFAHEWSGIKPDIITMAKGLGNGVPIGALLARSEVASAFVPGTHGCTFGGNFLSCAAALAAIEVLFDEKLMSNALTQGEYFARRLRDWGEQHDLVEEVRGRGLMVSAQLKKPIAREILKNALGGGLVLNAVGDNVLRFLPPLCISASDVDEAIGKLEAALSQVG